MRDAVRQAAPARSTRGLRHWLRKLHLWLGLSLGTVYALVALSGSVLALQGPLLRAMHPELDAHALPDAAQQAAVIERIAREWAPQGLRSADLPDADLPVWQLYFDGGVRRYLDPASGELLLTRTPDNDALLALRDWHTHLLAGHAGETWLGVIGWFSLFMLVSGVVLWWPGRGRFLAHLKPHTQPPVRRWLSWHRSFGALSLPLLLLVTLTGTLMIYHGGTRLALRTLFLDAPEPPQPAIIAPHDAPIDWPAVLAAAHQALPDATLGRISLPGERDGRVTLRARMPGEWNPTGRSMIWIDPYRARVLGTVDATRADTGVQVNNAIYALHAGTTGPLWRTLVIVSGLLPPFFLVTGFLFWRARTKRRG
ncbi:PepSY-associated TM helix domain-containing protein [Frateuria hangzhouensis]|uniref:PepSY-associated TM helix domain-containing protein n=1 Tax=Frateuria hangzhouensis TaxID=2995589 RepID=UPI002260A3A4|nr:PepSY-associated TM helix domain-containing protein [Frateuria sp. STR12]MCX7513981.1 PepSY-associated TM helix domain-containing protein [Frateuria sp. STR12]